MIPLDASVIAHNLSDAFKLHLFESIDSTNQFLKELPINHHIELCCAESQTHGRGRFGRTWHSPAGKNIYCSSRWYFNKEHQLSGLSLAVALALLATLEELGLSDTILIKWPNDLLWQDKKLAGILIEMMTLPTGLAVIIGIGVNVNCTTHEFNNTLKKSSCSLTEIHHRFLDRNQIIIQLMLKLKHYIEQFKQYGFKFFKSYWTKVDYLKNKKIVVKHANQILTGVAQGIDELGQLKLQTENGIIYLSVGETSLKL